MQAPTVHELTVLAREKLLAGELDAAEEAYDAVIRSTPQCLEAMVGQGTSNSVSVV